MAGPPDVTWQAPPGPTGPAAGVRFAGHPARLFAYVIDTMIQLVLGGAIVFVLGLFGAFAGGATADGAAAGATIGILAGGLAFFLIELFYFPFFWARGGQTPGMKALEIRVVRDADGGPVTWGKAFLRLIGFWISMWILYIGFAWILVDARRRGWADLLAGTCVIEAD